MNLLIPWHYKVGQLRIKPMPEKAPRPNLVIMGDSFMWQLASQISASAQCGEIATYFYAKLRKTTYVDGKAARAIDRLFKVDFGSEIFAADALVYEVNEGNIAPSDARITFVTEALEYAAHSPSKRVPFLSERARPYWWGEKIAFRHYDPNVRAGFLDGFLDPQPPVVWTAGQEAAIELAGSPPTRDLILEAEVGAVIPKPGYEQTVTLLANGERVAQWSIPTLERTKRRAMIPRQLVADGKLTLRLQLAVPPGGLQSAGAIPAPAVCFYGLQIFSGTGIAGQLPGPDDFKPYQLGEEISFQKGSSNVIPAKFASGFSANEAHGTWTDGTESEIRLRVPSSDRDLVLTAYLGGYFPPDKSEQLTAVYVNGEPVGQWSVTFTTPTKRRLVIPRACVGKNGEIDLQFQIAYPVSPFEAGQGADPRKLGLLFTQLDIRAGPKN
jgi:hypothetical protein